MSDFTSDFALTQVSFNLINNIESLTANQVGGSAAAAAAYATYILPFTTVFNLDNVSDVTTGDTNGPYEQQFTSAILSLNNLLKNGVPDETVAGQTDYVTPQMIYALSALYKSLGIVGIDINNPAGITNDQVQNWKRLALVDPTDMNPLMQNLVDASFSGQSIQAMVELVYVQTGNQLLTGILQNMESALQTTRDALNTLNSLQVLHNKVTINSKPTFASIFPFILHSGVGNPNSFVSLYKAAASAYFNTPIAPTITIGLFSGGAQFVSLEKHIASLIAQLSTVTPISSEAAASQTLLGQLKVVYANMQLASHAANTPASAFQLWILDNQDPAHKLSGLSAGDIQQNITNAITGGESLNNSQNQDVQRYLFVFQEFYKSASAILTALTQIIQTMARDISK